MIIKKYRPAFFEGFEEEKYEVNSKEELLQCKLIKDAAEYGEVCFSKNEPYFIMVVIEHKGLECGCESYIISILYNKQDAETIAEWLPSWDDVIEKYRIKKERTVV